jgi:hypothetical protein
MSDQKMNRQIDDWSELYRATILESDRDKFALLLFLAQNDIRERIQELWNAGSHETAEQERLDSASHGLELLRTSAEKGPEDDLKSQQ